MSGLTINRGDSTAQPSGWVVERRLGLTADRTRVVNYNDVEAAFLFKAPGKTVTAAECELYGISAEQQTSPSGWPARTPEPTAKAADKPEDKAVTRAEIEDKSVTRRTAPKHAPKAR